MRTKGRIRGRAAIIAALLCALTLSAAPSGSAVVGSTTPRNINDLRAVERRVQEVVKQVTPATVAILMRGSQGSGVIISRDGYVLTAGHVIGESGRECVVILADGRKVNAKTLGINRDIDSGLVKIMEEGDFPFAEMGRSTDITFGQWCLTLAHPGGYRRDRPPVLRLGRILMASDRTIMSDCTLVGGDSGGPLFNLDGKVIGINSRIGEPTSANLHVPVDSYAATWDRLADGEVWGFRGPRPGGAKLGATGVDDAKGCKIEAVEQGSAAELAGLKVNDIVTKFDGRSVMGLEQLSNLIARRRAGDEVMVEVLRGEETKEMRIRLGREGRRRRG